MFWDKVTGDPTYRRLRPTLLTDCTPTRGTLLAVLSLHAVVGTPVHYD